MSIKGSLEGGGHCVDAKGYLGSGSAGPLLVWSRILGVSSHRAGILSDFSSL